MERSRYYSSAAVLLCLTYIIRHSHAQGDIVAIGRIPGLPDIPVEVVSRSVCIDQLPDCDQRAVNGGCDADPAIMFVHCPATCNSCLPKDFNACINRGRNCFYASLSGECVANPSYNLRFCAGSCRQYIDVCRPERGGLDQECLAPKTVAGMKEGCGFKTSSNEDTRRRRSAETKMSNTTTRRNTEKLKQQPRETESHNLAQTQSQVPRENNNQQIMMQKGHRLRNTEEQLHNEANDKQTLNIKSLLLKETNGKPLTIIKAQLLKSTEGAQLMRNLANTHKDEYEMKNEGQYIKEDSEIKKEQEMVKDSDEHVAKLNSSAAEIVCSVLRKTLKNNSFVPNKHYDDIIKGQNKDTINNTDYGNYLQKLVVFLQEYNLENKLSEASSSREGRQNVDLISTFSLYLTSIFNQSNPTGILSNKTWYPNSNCFLGYGIGGALAAINMAMIDKLSSDEPECPLKTLLPEETEELPVERQTRTLVRTVTERFRDTVIRSETVTIRETMTVRETITRTVMQTQICNKTETVSRTTPPVVTPTITVSLSSNIKSSGQKERDPFVPFCDVEKVDQLRDLLVEMTGKNTGRPLPDAAVPILEAVHFCQFGGPLMPDLARNIFNGQTPDGWHGLSSPSKEIPDRARHYRLSKRETEENVIRIVLRNRKLNNPKKTTDSNIKTSSLRRTPRQNSYNNHETNNNTPDQLISIENARRIRRQSPVYGLPVNRTLIKPSFQSIEDKIEDHLPNKIDKILNDQTLIDFPSKIDTPPNLQGPSNKTESDDDNEPDNENTEELIVALQSSVDRIKFNCGGALITDNHILTAAHCFISTVANDIGPNVVRLGEVDFSDTEESETRDYSIKYLAAHPQYRAGGTSRYFDIAVITLTESVEGFSPYCLPAARIPLEGRECTVSGWGQRPNELASEVLRDVPVTVRNLRQCEDSYRTNRQFFSSYYPEGFKQDFLCASGRIPGEDACRGDSGGPLVLDDSLEIMVGVVSTGYGCGNPNFPGLYTRTDAYIPWIDLQVFQSCSQLAFQMNDNKTFT